MDCQYCMEGVLTRVKGKLFRERKPIYVFLFKVLHCIVVCFFSLVFKDMLICAKQIAEKEKQKPESLSNYRFSFLGSIPFDTIVGVRSSNGILLYFHSCISSLICLAFLDGFHINITQPKKKDYLFCAGTPDKKEIWIKALQENFHTPQKNVQ